jgi:hypothetical protein
MVVVSIATTAGEWEYGDCFCGVQERLFEKHSSLLARARMRFSCSRRERREVIHCLAELQVAHSLAATRRHCLPNRHPPAK